MAVRRGLLRVVEGSLEGRFVFIIMFVIVVWLSFRIIAKRRFQFHAFPVGYGYVLEFDPVS